MEALAEWIRVNIPGGMIDHVFAISGGRPPRSTISNLDESTFLQTIRLKSFSLICAAQFLIPLLRDEDSSSFTIVSGGLGEYCIDSQYSLTTIGNSLQYGITQAIMAEQRGKKIRINEFRIVAYITYEGLTENPNLPGYPAAPTTELAKLYDAWIIKSNARDKIHRPTGSALGLPEGSY